jgi:1-deoxy-D-xylulose-5-phosphate synthase
MREGSGLVRFGKEHPDRYHDVGIAEQHAVTFAAGLAANGLRPVVAIYSSFLQRAYDQLIHDVALQQLPVVFAIDRAGLVGPDGATHNGSMDLSFLRCVPNLVVMAPADGSDLRDMLQTGLSIDGPSAIRYPRATLVPPPDQPAKALPLGVSDLRRKGSRVAILVFGTLLDTALEVAEEIGATVVNMRFVKPLDVRRVFDIARSHDLIVTLEENAVTGGAGSAVGECLAARNLRTPLLQIGLSDDFTEHGTREEVLKDAGLDRAGILSAIERQRAMLAARTTVAVAIGSATLSVALAAGRLLSTLGPAPPGRRLGDVRDGADPG